jgi:hypothetical protein
MKERFLFGRITGEGGHVIYRHAQMTGFVKRTLQMPRLPDLNQAAMPAGVTLQRAVLEMFGQLRRACGGHLVQNFSE